MRNLVLTMIAATTVACATAPDTQSERANLDRQAQATLQTMITKDPSLPRLLNESAGYAVFPSIGKGGFIAGGAYGRGVLYERGRRVGFVDLSQASIGAQIGGQTFAELIVFRTPFDVQRLKRGEFSLGANVSAVALTAGAAGSADTSGGVAVLVMPRGGLMAELSVSGQKINFQGG